MYPKGTLRFISKTSKLFNFLFLRKIKFCLHYGKKDVKWGINYNFSEKTTMIFAAKTVLYEMLYQNIDMDLL